MASTARYCCCGGCKYPKIWLVIAGLDASLCGCRSDGFNDINYTAPTLDGEYELILATLASSDPDNGVCFYNEDGSGPFPNLTIPGFIEHKYTLGSGCVGTPTNTSFSGGLLVELNNDTVVRTELLLPGGGRAGFENQTSTAFGVARANAFICPGDPGGSPSSLFDGGTMTVYNTDPTP